MGSKAFTTAPRSVLACTKGPEDDGTYLFGQSKNNLDGLAPTLAYRIHSVTVGNASDGSPIQSASIQWLGESALTVDDVHADQAESGGRMEGLTQTEEAMCWLPDYLAAMGGSKRHRLSSSQPQRQPGSAKAPSSERPRS